jgi:hypothetical protein
MEADDPSERPKGFVRRNWVGLILLLSFLSLTFLNFIVATGGWYPLFCTEGEVWIGESKDLESAPLFSGVTLAAPHLGTWPRREADELDAYLVIPVWCPLLLITVGISFREWRRKRAAEDKACQQ